MSHMSNITNISWGIWRKNYLEKPGPRWDDNIK